MTPQERLRAAREAGAALTPPKRAREADSAAHGDSAPAAEDGTAELPVVSGMPRQGSRTVTDGTAPPRCRHCLARVGGTEAVVACPGGWCIATLCRCSQWWYTQESPMYATPDEAEQAWLSGN
ncbi:hypothetical protein FHX42_005175 [Saccharopolyspora lacisalsi]|uniref:Uncharacterized protein n=1 Tax=Halosaccharopolyspora lacisalsi TaxID=1000566 RepID=A0A839EA97_9PSEU|nr:hypothetical protein [Halosaccharopolyspora lacisalsi]